MAEFISRVIVGLIEALLHTLIAGTGRRVLSLLRFGPNPFAEVLIGLVLWVLIGIVLLALLRSPHVAPV
jgi:hypothetical protein